MSARLIAFVVWLAAAGSLAFWANRLLAKPVPVPAQASVAAPALVAVGPMTRLFGAAPVVASAQAEAPAADARFKLLGVAAGRAGQPGGWALIAVDDKPARAFALGGHVDNSLVVRTITHRQVELGPQGSTAATVSLTLPPVAEAARGVPAGVNAPAAPAPGALGMVRPNGNLGAAPAMPSLPGQMPQGLPVQQVGHLNNGNPNTPGAFGGVQPQLPMNPGQVTAGPGVDGMQGAQPVGPSNQQR